LTKVFIGNKAIIRVFSVLVWLSIVSGSKVMTWQQQIIDSSPNQLNSSLLFVVFRPWLGYLDQSVLVNFQLKTCFVFQSTKG